MEKTGCCCWLTCWLMVTCCVHPTSWAILFFWPAATIVHFVKCSEIAERQYGQGFTFGQQTLVWSWKEYLVLWFLINIPIRNGHRLVFPQFNSWANLGWFTNQFASQFTNWPLDPIQGDALWGSLDLLSLFRSNLPSDQTNSREWPYIRRKKSTPCQIRVKNSYLATKGNQLKPALHTG